jgi:hypothetical protein
MYIVMIKGGVERIHGCYDCPGHDDSWYCPMAAKHLKKDAEQCPLIVERMVGPRFAIFTRPTSDDYEIGPEIRELIDTEPPLPDIPRKGGKSAD